MKDDIGVLLARAYIVFVDDLREHLADRGFDDLPAAFGYVARTLADGPITLRDLADRFQITSQGAIKIVNELEAKGYLRREPDPTDGRQKRLHLSAKGLEALAAARAFHANYEKRLARRIGSDKVRIGREALEAMVEAGEQRTGRSAALRPM